MWKQSPHIQCVAAVKSKASSNSGENERETAEFGAVRPWDPPKTQLSRNLFWKNISDTISPSPTYRGNRNWLFGFRRKFLTILIQILNEHYSWPSQYSNVKSIDQFEQPSLHQWCLEFWNRGNILDPGGVGSWEGLVSLKCPQSCSCHALEEVSWLLGSNHLRLYILLDEIYWVPVLAFYWLRKSSHAGIVNLDWCSSHTVQPFLSLSPTFVGQWRGQGWGQCTGCHPASYQKNMPAYYAGIICRHLTKEGSL